MDLELDEDQIALRDNFRAVLEEYCTPASLREIYEEGNDGGALWKQVVELGWPALAVPEADGGLGYGFVEVALLAEELGRAAAPATLLACATLVAPALVAGESPDAHIALTALAGGEFRGALAWEERGRMALESLRARAVKSEGTWTLNGVKHAVVAGAVADRFAVVAIDAESGHPGLYLVDGANAQVLPTGGIDRALLMADVHLNDSPARVLILPSADSRGRIEKIAAQAAVGMAMHVVGACRMIFETTLEYARVRKQYGRVIGSFQALKHRFAEMYLAVERATALCYFAAVSIEEGDPGSTEAAHLAKAAAGDCQRLIAQDGLQLHGGIGFTWEQDLHFWLKRAKAGEMLCGTSAWHRAQLASLLGLNFVEGETTNALEDSA